MLCTVRLAVPAAMGCVSSKADINDRHPNIFQVMNVDDAGRRLCPGQIEVTELDLVLYQRGKAPVRWPLRCLRRYGFDADLFSFESGRRCPTGPGIYAFQCRRAEQLFNVLQAQITVRNEHSSDDLSSILPSFHNSSASTSNSAVPAHTLASSVFFTSTQPPRPSAEFLPNGRFSFSCPRPSLTSLSHAHSLANGLRQGMNGDLREREVIDHVPATEEESGYLEPIRISGPAHLVRPLSAASVLSRDSTPLLSPSGSSCGSSAALLPGPNSALYMNSDIMGFCNMPSALPMAPSSSGLAVSSTSSMVCNMNMLRIPPPSTNLPTLHEYVNSGALNTGAEEDDEPPLPTEPPPAYACMSPTSSDVASPPSGAQQADYDMDTNYARLDELLKNEQEARHLYMNIVPEAVKEMKPPPRPLALSTLAPPESLPLRQVNYIMLDLDKGSASDGGGSGSSASTNQPTSPPQLSLPSTMFGPAPDSPQRPAPEGYATIDFDRTAALSHSATPSVDPVEEGLRMTRHSLAFPQRHLLSRNNSSMSE